LRSTLLTWLSRFVSSCEALIDCYARRCVSYFGARTKCDVVVITGIHPLSRRCDCSHLWCYRCYCWDPLCGVTVIADTHCPIAIIEGIHRLGHHCDRRDCRQPLSYYRHDYIQASTVPMLRLQVSAYRIIAVMVEIHSATQINTNRVHMALIIVRTIVVVCYCIDR
jgi:hypothetical protein